MFIIVLRINSFSIPSTESTDLLSLPIAARKAHSATVLTGKGRFSLRLSRLVSATDKGKRLLTKCYEHFARTAEITFWGMGEDDKKLCIQLLRGVEIKHSKVVHGMKGKIFMKYTSR